MTKQSLSDALNKLCKWRMVFAGWQLGTRSSDDPECQAVRDHREVTILLRAEVTALIGLLIERGVFTTAEFTAALTREAAQLDKDYERHFPGFTTSLMGVHVDVRKASETMKGWKP